MLPDLGRLPGLLGLPGLQARSPSKLTPLPGFFPVIPPEVRAALLAKLASTPAPGQEEEKKQLTELFEEGVAVVEVAAQLLVKTLRKTDKYLRFWTQRAQGGGTSKLRFMLLERGAWAFGVNVVEYVRRSVGRRGGGEELSLEQQALQGIVQRVERLTAIRNRLATTLAQVHSIGSQLASQASGGEVRRALSGALAELLDALERLQGEYPLPQDAVLGRPPPSQSASFHVSLRPRSTSLKGGQSAGRPVEWRSVVLQKALACVHQDLLDLQSAVTSLLKPFRPPGRRERLWVRYGVGAVIVTGAGMWLVRHSRLAGSDDLERWGGQLADSVAAFYKEHVKDPLTSIGGEIFSTFHERPRAIVEPAEIKANEESLRRMLEAFSVDSKAELSAPPSQAKDQELMDVVMRKYEAELLHPVRSIVSGELARALLIQIQKLKLDVQVAMLELDQVLRSNEINFGVMAALPALLLFAAALYGIRQATRPKDELGSGRLAQTRRRQLLAEAEGIVLDALQTEGREGQRGDGVLQGRLLFVLHRLYQAAQPHAVANDEWDNLRGDLLALAQVDLSFRHKRRIARRMYLAYDCLTTTPLPS